MQLVAYGAEDIYLTGNPMMTYFQIVYRRHTNFAIESMLQKYNGVAGFGQSISLIFERTGDLLAGICLEVKLPPLINGSWIHDVGNFLINKTEIEIGCQLIDRQYGDWMEIWSQLTVTSSKRLGYNSMIGEGSVSYNGEYIGLQSIGDHDEYTLMIPLQFWFCRNIGLALPLIALQYHEVKLNVTFSDLASVASGTVNGNLECEIYADYIYLDTDERRIFATLSHEYLIEQVQYHGSETYNLGGITVTYPLTLNHPVKELIWTCQDNSNKVLDVAKFIAGYGDDYIIRVYVDRKGCIYICGTSGSAELNGVVNPVNRNSGFIAKLSRNYNVIWHKWIFGTNNTVVDLKCDNIGNIYCCGETDGGGVGLQINDVLYAKTAEQVSAQDVYAVKLTSEGNVIWFKWVSGEDIDIINNINQNKFALDGNNNMYFCLQTFSTHLTLVNLDADGNELGNNLISTTVAGGGVIYKIAEDGSVSWYGEFNNAKPFTCVITSDNTLIVSGTKGAVAVNTTLKIWSGDGNKTALLNTVFVLNDASWCMKLALSGTQMFWFRGFVNSAGFLMSASDNQGNIILGGSARNDIIVQEIIIQDSTGTQVGDPMIYRGTQPGFIVKLLSNGNLFFYVWGGVHSAYDISCDTKNNIVLINKNFEGTLTITSSTNETLYEDEKASPNFEHILSFNTNGMFLYSKEIRIINSIYILDDAVYCTGLLENTGLLQVLNSDGTIERYIHENIPDIDKDPGEFNQDENGNFIGFRNAYIYRYNLNPDIVYNAPDPFSVGTADIGSDNFTPFIRGKNPIASACLILNGNERFAERVGDYFNLFQTYNHHSCIPKSRGINVYSFALTPEDHQPSGTCNFSRIDNSHLRLTYRPELIGGIMKLYAVNYNVLRIMSGMCGLAYSN